MINILNNEIYLSNNKIYLSNKESESILKKTKEHIFTYYNSDVYKFKKEELFYNPDIYNKSFLVLSVSFEYINVDKNVDKIIDKILLNGGKEVKFNCPSASELSDLKSLQLLKLGILIKQL